MTEANISRMPMTLTLGPLLFNWTPDRWRDFYAQIADEAPVDFVCIGEVVCSKRAPFYEELVDDAVTRLERAGKTVMFSTLILPTLDRERRQIADLAGASERLVEANDVSALAHLSGRPHAIGPYVNVYNEGTLAVLARKGAARICLPPELPLASVRAITAGLPQPVAVEVFAFGRAPLAIAARCYHARIHGLAKDSCQFVCGEDPDGLDADTLDGEPFLSVNGVQTLSRTYVSAIGEIPALAEAGVSGLRLSPQTADMAAVARLFREVLDGACEPLAAAGALRTLTPGVALSNGFLHGIEGVKYAGSE
jgi:collagenase-like PrtC family protease